MTPVVLPNLPSRWGARPGWAANDFTYALLMDGREAIRAGLTYSWEVAEHFGVPDEIVGFSRT